MQNVSSIEGCTCVWSCNISAHGNCSILMFTIDCVTFVYLIVEIIYIVKCACMNSIIVGMGGATLFLLLPIMLHVLSHTFLF